MTHVHFPDIQRHPHTMTTEVKTEKKLGEVLAEIAERTKAAAEKRAEAGAKKDFEAWLPGSSDAIALLCSTTLTEVARSGQRQEDFRIGFVIGKLGLKSCRLWKLVVPLLEKQALTVTALDDDYVRISF